MNILCIFVLLSLVSADFRGLYDDWKAACDRLENNIVLTVYNDVDRDRKTVRNSENSGRIWSLASNTFLRDYLTSDIPHCSTIQELTLMLDKPLSSHSCGPKWQTVDDICDIMKSFSVIIFHGDVFTKHLVQALYMLWTEDLRYGAFPKDPLRGNSVIFKYCGCDGQFSLSPLCLRFIDRKHYSFKDCRDSGLCTWADKFKSPSFYYVETFPSAKNEVPGQNHQTPNWTSSVTSLCSDDKRPRFVFLEAGLHLFHNASSLVTKFILPKMSAIYTVIKNCKYPIHDLIRIVFSDSSLPWTNYYSRSIHKFQNTSLLFSSERQKHFKDLKTLLAKHPQLQFVSFHRIVMEAYKTSYDGNTSLTDVNILKAIYTLNLMEKKSRTY
jgi:hypothetical protein